MVGDLSRELSSRGHHVHVLTSRQTYEGTAGARKAHDGVTVSYLWVAGGWSRLASWILFWLQACLRVPFGRWDRCVLLTDPPFMVFCAFLARLVGPEHRKVYWWTMDLYPESLVARGAIRAGGWAHRLLLMVNEIGIRALEGVICLGERQRKRLRRYRNWPGKPESSIVVPPWDYRRLERPACSANTFLREHGWEGKKVALYAGNLGQAHTYEELLEAARLLESRGDDEWVFVFVTRGAKRDALEAESRGLSNVFVLDYVPPERTADLLWSADVHCITMAAGWEGVVVPSKLYGVLRTTAPVLFIGPEDADTAAEIRSLKDGTAGAVLPVGCGGQEVVQALGDLMNGRRPCERPGLAGPSGASRIAAFVTGETRLDH